MIISRDKSAYYLGMVYANFYFLRLTKQKQDKINFYL